MKPQKSKVTAKRRGIGSKLMRKDDLIVVPQCVGGNMVFWNERLIGCSRPQCLSERILQDGHEITGFDMAGREG